MFDDPGNCLVSTEGEIIRSSSRDSGPVLDSSLLTLMEVGWREGEVYGKTL